MNHIRSVADFVNPQRDASDASYDAISPTWSLCSKFLIKPQPIENRPFYLFKLNNHSGFKPTKWLKLRARDENRYSRRVWRATRHVADLQNRPQIWCDSCTTKLVYRVQSDTITFIAENFGDGVHNVNSSPQTIVYAWVRVASRDASGTPFLVYFKIRLL